MKKQEIKKMLEKGINTPFDEQLIKKWISVALTISVEFKLTAVEAFAWFHNSNEKCMAKEFKSMQGFFKQGLEILNR